MATPHPDRSRCPECDAPQLTRSPYCEQCGFRLRAQETEIEGERALAPPAPPAPPAPSRTVFEGLPALNASQSASRPEPARSARSDNPDSSDSSPQVTQPHPRAVPDRSSDALHAVRPPPRSALGWIAPLCGGAMLGAVLGVAFAWGALARSPAASDFKPLKRAPDHRVAFPATQFTRGLDEATQSRLLRLCYKFSDDPDTECEQQTLLAGEYPQQRVDVAPFALDANEVSNQRYAQCVARKTCAPIDYEACEVRTPQGLQIALRVPKLMRQPDRPVVCLSRAMASRFCASEGGRLPSAEEWELAARGTRDGRLFPWGDSWDPALANWGELDVTRTVVPGKLDGFVWTAPVGALPEGASPFGLLDMAGNVSEWVAPSRPGEEARGASFADPAYSLRVTKRFAIDESARRTDVGARCAYDVAP